MNEADLIWNGCLNWNIETDLNVYHDYLDSETFIWFVRVDHSIRAKYCN